MLVYFVHGSLNPLAAIICFGVGGIIGLAIAVVLFARTSPAETLTTTAKLETKPWLQNCGWFLILAFLMSWVYEISVIVLEVANVAELEIARYGAAAKTGCFILLVAKSTNKFYQPELAVIMSNHDWQRASVLRRKRFVLVGSACLTFLLVMILFGKLFLRMFGPEYEAAHLALCFIAFGACVSTTFSMASEYLKFSEKLKTVMLTTCAGGILLVILTWILGVRFGATGAGLAFGIVTSLMTTIYFLIANRMLNAEIERDNVRTIGNRVDE